MAHGSRTAIRKNAVIVWGAGTRRTNASQIALYTPAVSVGSLALANGHGNASSLPDETFFPVVQRKVLSHNDFTDLGEVEQRLAEFEKRYNATARPSRCRFTRDDLRDLLARIDHHEREDKADIPLAA